MNRTLRRPMFRIGGSAEGITSGLSRQGYAHEPGHVKQDDFSKTKVSDIGDLSIGQIQELTKAPGPDINDFLMNFGLDLVSRPKSGNILQQAATSATGPFKEFLTGKREADILGADRFKTLLEAHAKAEAGKAEGSGWLEQWKFKQIPILNKTIKDLTTKQDNGTITDDELLELENVIDQKSRIVGLDPVTEAWLKTKDGGYAVVDMKNKLFVEDQKLPEDERKYMSDKDIQLTLDAIEAVKRRLGMAEGGRAGYQNAGSVMPNAMQAAGPTDQGSEIPPEIQNIDYETLRTRLPNTITDDIVRLIANSAEAMEDFATIQTQQDVNNFNKKYGVELILPSEA